jgi:predicted dehydrogenase
MSHAPAERKRYVVAGAGARGIDMFIKPLLRSFPHYCELVALFDHNPLRMRAANEHLGADLPAYTDFDRMLCEAKPDAVVVATRDSTHAEYIIRALAAGKRVISEKPVATDARQLSEILRAAAHHRPRGALCLVTHNMRYHTGLAEMRRLIQAGAIGDIKAVNFHENLDRHHGADYFRRWHRAKENSGGLLVHKASHHFDALNWMVDSVPVDLVAQGALLFYGNNGPFRHERCSGCPHASQCDFHVDLWQSDLKRRLYRDAESDDGYIRDGCVFDPSIDIEDQASVLYTYANGAKVTYSITAFATYEGWHIQIEGTRGRLEHKDVLSAPAANAAAPGTQAILGQSLTLSTARDGVKTIPIPTRTGMHGGADDALRQDFFGRPFDAPLTASQAPLEQAVQAVLIGHAANVSIANGSKPVKIQQLLEHHAQSR